MRITACALFLAAACAGALAALVGGFAGLGSWENAQYPGSPAPLFLGVAASLTADPVALVMEAGAGPVDGGTDGCALAVLAYRLDVPWTVEPFVEAGLGAIGRPGESFALHPSAGLGLGLGGHRAWVAAVLRYRPAPFAVRVGDAYPLRRLWFGASAGIRLGDRR